ncbi:alpha-hydroxy acid oxidase [Rhizorhabdus histidinilytica]|uniref:L-lactate dehydrogenase (Cytochrome)/(S)-mandelate dehydrogenase n=2 Tax=Rhizorhabdus histidinilytica TaxID=439228 RepID=A0A1T5EMK4_9SPHN|nr:alpha-hydroxy acid oxidase [Rhizorhabdus histidinilytica]SKB85105.1 L-lactate dehydrogenase (cytochrome)/(S)-mandelate dehydrogenase [Rhizorhabdus histidinilytica]
MFGFPPSLETMHNIADFEAAARRRLPRGLFDYIARGAEDDRTLRANRRGFEEIGLRPRILADVSRRRLDARILGRDHRLPLGIAPTGPPGFLWHKGELALARAAAALDVPLVLSCAATVPMERVIEAGHGAKWFQLYMSGDRALSLRLIEKARRTGFDALVLTVDSIVSPNREFAAKSGYTVPPKVTPRIALEAIASPRWLIGTIGRYMLDGGLPTMVDYPLPDPADPMKGGVPLKDDSISWETLAEIRALWPGKLIVKGVLDPRDAVACADAGADAMIVSNHGGLVLDGGLATIEALPAIAAAVGPRLEIYLDGGIRRGSDVIKALALGAKAVFLGRALLFALAAFGETGVVRALELLGKEIDRTLASMGCSSLDELDRNHVVLPGERYAVAPFDPRDG